MSELRNKAFHGLKWSFAQQFGVQIVNFSISILLARLLLPSEFGLIGMISIFIVIGNSLVDSGMTSSLIRTNNSDYIDYSTVFFSNLIFSFLVYIIMFFLAPKVGLFFNKPILSELIRVYSIIFIIRAFSTVQSTKLNKEMDFKTQMMINLPSLVLGGLFGILLAIYEFGVWSLVGMNLSQSIIATIQLWIRAKWKPTFILDLERLKRHLSFGYKVTLSGLINSFVKNINNIIIGKFFSAEQLGFFVRAKSMQEIPVDTISSALNKVTYPLFSSIMHDDVKLRSVYQRLVQQVFFVTTPILITAIVIAEPLFRFLLTDKWLPAIPYFQILCISGIVVPLNSYNLNILLVKGRSGQYLKLETFKNILIATSALLVFPFGIIGLTWGLVLTFLMVFFVNAYFCGQVIKLSVKEQLEVILPIVLLGCFCGFAGYFVNLILVKLLLYDFVKIILIVTFIFSTYLLMSYKVKIHALFELIGMIKKNNL